jgi:hypothetical protein
MSTVADITRNTRTVCIIPGLDLHIDVADVIVNMPVAKMNLLMVLSWA